MVLVSTQLLEHHGAQKEAAGTWHPTARPTDTWELEDPKCGIGLLGSATNWKALMVGGCSHYRLIDYLDALCAHDA